jgi:hypothetical protein
MPDPVKEKGTWSHLLRNLSSSLAPSLRSFQPKSSGLLWIYCIWIYTFFMGLLLANNCWFVNHNNKKLKHWIIQWNCLQNQYFISNSIVNSIRMFQFILDFSIKLTKFSITVSLHTNKILFQLFSTL